MKKSAFHIKPAGIKVQLKKFYQGIFQINDSPEKIAYGFALGTFIGLTPFVGFQVLISIFLAKSFGWNKVAAGIAVFNTNVLTGTFLFGINYLIGSALTGAESLSLFQFEMGISLFSFILRSGQQVFFSFLIGSFITGIPLSLLAYILVKRIFSKKTQKLIPKNLSHGI